MNNNIKTTITDGKISILDKLNDVNDMRTINSCIIIITHNYYYYT